MLDRLLFKFSNAPFNQEDAREMAELMKAVGEFELPILKTWYCASILRAVCSHRLASHYGQHDAGEIRYREKTDELALSIKFNSIWGKVSWNLIAAVLFATPLRYLKRIHNVDRTQTGSGVNTMRWRLFLKSLCKEWTDSNLLATVLVSGTVAFLAIPQLDGMARMSGILSALYALSSVLCGMLLLSKHQDRVESFGSMGMVYFNRTKARGAGTAHLLAILLSLPRASMLWSMIWFILAVMCYAHGPSTVDIPQRYLVAARYISFILLGVFTIVGVLVLGFFYEIWSISASSKADADLRAQTETRNGLQRFIWRPSKAEIRSTDQRLDMSDTIDDNSKEEEY
ncbi:hypothetical protein FRC12_018367 [Ceratobasidium sp. 428]|nr:hypothetical protein FRC12_018367 [Ceratobasidium sp. 428]